MDRIALPTRGSAEVWELEPRGGEGLDLELDWQLLPPYLGERFFEMLTH